MSPELRRHGSALLALMRLDSSAIERFDPTPAAARRALELLWFSIPLDMFACWVSERVLIGLTVQQHALYFVVRLIQALVAVLLPLPLVRAFVGTQTGMAARFPLYMTTYLWLGLFWAVYSALANGLTFNIVFAIGTIKAISTVLFFISYALSSYVAMLALRCNPFMAVGVATIQLIVVSVTGDLSNIYLFGSPRPLIGQ